MAIPVARFALALCPALLLLPGTLRAGGPGDALSTFAADCQAGAANEGNAFDDCGAQAPPLFEVNASLLFLQPSAGNLVYATTINPYPLLSPHWSDQAVNPRFTPAFNVGARYFLDCCCDIQLNWTHLNAFDGASQVSNVPLPPQPGPPPLSGSSSTQAFGPPFLIGTPPPFAAVSAVAHFDYDAVNIDAGMFLTLGNHVQLRPFAGLQVGRVSESLTAHFVSVDRIITFTDDSRSLFTGVGPRLGMDMHYLAGNFDLLGQVAGSTLMGTRQSSIDFFTYSPQTIAAGLTPNAQSLTSPNSTQVIPCIDTKLGGSYAIPVGRFGTFRCEAGYQAAVYFNAINQFSLTEVENTTVMNTEGTAAHFLRTAVEQQSNFFVHGPYVKFSFQF